MRMQIWILIFTVAIFRYEYLYEFLENNEYGYW